MIKERGFSPILILSLVGAILLVVIVIGSISGVKKFTPPFQNQTNLVSTDFEQEDEEDEDEVDELENIEID